MTASMAGWIAIAAAVVSVIGLTIALVLHLRLRRVRAAQLTLQGSGGGDLVDFAVSLQGRVDGGHRTLDDFTGSLGRLPRRVAPAASRPPSTRRCRGSPSSATTPTRSLVGTSPLRLRCSTHRAAASS